MTSLFVFLLLAGIGGYLVFVTVSVMFFQKRPGDLLKEIYLQWKGKD